VTQKKIGDDFRDYQNTAGFMISLSNKALREIAHIKRSEIRKRLRNNVYPFSRLNKEARETLAFLPTSWVYGSAECLLQERKHI